jgi:hypothetical protein
MENHAQYEIVNQNAAFYLRCLFVCCVSESICLRDIDDTIYIYVSESFDIIST